MDDLLKDAIADAKAVRETALANAKIALEEAFTPRLQSMLSRKIQSEMEDADETEDAEERGMSEEEAEEMMDKDEMEAEEMMDKDEMEDAEEMKMDAEEEMDAEEMMDADEMEDKDEMEDAEEEEKMDETEDKDEMEDEMSEMEDKDEEEKMDEAEDAEEEDELDLESVLRELEADLKDAEEEEEKMDEEMSDKDEEEKVDENDVSSEIGKSDNKVADKANDSSSVGQGPESEGSDKKAGAELGDHKVVKEVEDKDEDDDIDLDEVLKALSEEEDAEEEADKVEELKKEITETRNVVKFMRAKLNEVNLLNAKLLFSNKLFRAFGLNNNQKLKVVENFDRTKNLREVKLVYATLAESFKKPSKLSESVVKGSSSKPVASTKPAKEQVLSEGSELKARFKKLANIL